jgi:uncharacterized membrane protein AbrB (regulator of aidB expression)
MLAWAAWGLAVGGLATIPWFDQLARQADRPELTQLNASTIPYLAALVIAATVGAVLASRPAHPVGWLLLALALSVSSSWRSLPRFANQALHGSPRVRYPLRYRS